MKSAAEQALATAREALTSAEAWLEVALTELAAPGTRTDGAIRWSIEKTGEALTNLEGIR